MTAAAWAAAITAAVLLLLAACESDARRESHRHSRTDKGETRA